jgi:sodium-dependent phosphate transporter
MLASSSLPSPSESLSSPRPDRPYAPNSYENYKEASVTDVPIQKPKDAEDISSASSSNEKSEEEPRLAPLETKPKIEGSWILPKNLLIIVKRIPSILTHGVNVDVHAMQRGPAGSVAGERMRKMHALTKQYPNRTEHLFSFLQVMTACTASFAHGCVPSLL